MQQEQEDLGKEREVLSLIKKRSGKLGALTRKRNEIHTLIDNGENTTVIEEHMKVYNRFLEEFMDVQVAVQSLLNEDERESDHTDWYEPKLISCREFIDDIETWLKQDASQDAANNVSAVENVSHAASRKSYDVEPHDSVSQTAKPARPSSKAAASKSSSSSSASRKSKTLSEMAIQAELERVTLLKQADALQEKHALELEEAQLNAVMKAKRETLSVKTNLAIAKAKSQVFKEQEETQKSKSLASSGASTPTQFISPQRAMKQTKMSPAPVPLSTVGPTTSVAPPIYAKSKAKTRHLQQSADSNNDQPDLAEAMRRQNEITAMLIKQQRQSLLPPIQVPVFDGDPLQFRSFIKAFEQGIESKTDDMQVKLYYLEQFTSGQPRKLVQSCMHMSPQTAFGEAKKQLEWNFGSKVKVTAAFLNKALDWPALKADDGVGVALRSYTFFLRTSYNTTEDAGYLDEMENSSHMKVFVSKLPFRMRESWRMKVCSIREEQKRRVKFKDLLDFLERQVRAAMDPVFCEIQNTRAKATTPPTPKSIGKAKGSSFATSVAQVPHQSDTPNVGNAGKIQCLFCNDGHILDKCTTFKKKPNKDKITFLQSKGVCFGCLVQGHLSRNCQERLTCRTCSKNHPTVLHIEPKPQNTPADHETQTVSNALVSLDSEGDTGVGSKECSLSVLPVKVRLNKSTKVIETYAFLDPGSSATFCTESLMTQLNAPGQKMDILLKTMGQEKYVSSHKISGLEVAALNDNKFLRLPDVYTQKSIPVTKDNIPKEEDLKKWPYLQEVELTPINASIGLLIGANAPKALEPWKIVNSEGNGPYAVQTRLGWVINGPLGQEDSDDSDTASVQVNRISLGKLEEMLIKQYNQDFVEQHCDEHAELSVEDKQFMEIMSSSATLTNGHYYLKLPFRDSNVVMPNNKQVAQQRAQHLLKKFKRDQLPMERALGVQWDVEQDSFTFSILNKHKPLTRRGILSSVSSIYDPLGFLSPVILPAKQILQQLCKLKLAWDEAIPPEMAQTWQRWVDDLILLHSFSVRRCFTPSEFGNVEMAQLHHFCDASEVGFGAVSYLRLTNSEKEVCVAFVIGKARVAPLKHVTIPRLELAAAVVAVRLDKMLSKQLELNLSESVFWSDSMTVLKYIANTTTRFKTYVANRVSIISSLSNVGQWRHVGSKMNPADAASRGMKVGAFLKSSTWITGPDFLGKTEREWPASVDKASLHPDADPEVREEVLSFAAQAEEVCPTTKLLLHFSSWTRLKRAVAWIMKLKEKLRLKIKENAQCGDQTPVKQVKKTNYLPLTVDDLLLAEEAIVRFVQKKHYSSELAALKSGGVKKSSQLYKLDPIAIDDVLRVGGRLSRSALPVETKHPAILPKESHVSKLILQHVHNKVGHRGRNHMLSTLRRQYWIPHANAAARKIISECVICLKQRQRPGEQKMSDLPVDRVTADAPPFTHVGLDYFGPIEVKKGRSLVKRYGALFTCLTCRAVHLEVAHSLNTDSCINAIRRFICRRGQVKEIRTDNGTNFVSTNRELKQAIAELNHSKIQKSLMQDGIKWTFNPPYGAHHGGVWERLVQDVKRLLRSVTNQQALDDEALQTVFCEAEAILNDRPITTSSGDPNDIEALTPNHLLQLKGKPILPPGLFKKDDLYARRRWRQVQYIADLFWKRWTTEYLPQLQERQKWNKVHRNFTVGDIVLVVEESAPRGAWPIGRITDTMADSKGCVRRVRVKTQTNELEKPITKICLLVGVV